MKLNSLRTKFLATFLPLFLGSFLVFFAISYYMSSTELIRDADTISANVGRSTANDIEKIFQKHTMEVESLSMDSALLGASKEQIVGEVAKYEAKASKEGAMRAFACVDGRGVGE